MTVFSISLLYDICYVLFNFTRFLFIFRCFHLFLISSSFLFHFSSFIYSFRIFLFFCVSHESIMCFICKLLFSVLSLLAFCKSSEKSAKIIRTIGETQIPFNFSVVLFWSSQLVNLFYFYPPSHPYHFTGNHPTPKPTTLPGASPIHLPRGLWERRCPNLPEVLRYTHL